MYIYTCSAIDSFWGFDELCILPEEYGHDLSIGVLRRRLEIVRNDLLSISVRHFVDPVDKV